jgi:hypothetical protein
MLEDKLPAFHAISLKDFSYPCFVAFGVQVHSVVLWDE